MRNLIVRSSVLSIVVLIAACNPTPTPTATGVVDCGWDGTAVAWLDANANGIWDENEMPLTNIKFYVDGWDEWWINDTIVNKDVPTGGVGISVWLAGCPDVSFQVCAELPENYQATTNICVTPKQDWDEILQFGFST